MPRSQRSKETALLRFVRSALIHTLVFGTAAVTAAACFSVDYNNPALRCAPNDKDDPCPSDFTCCSDDPTADQGLLPKYTLSLHDGGVPIFADGNNALSTQGMCVELTSAIRASSQLGNGCPTPCDPTWAAGDVATVCGAGQECCQTQQLDHEKDCVLDSDTNLWRPVTGDDIFDGGVSPPTTWSGGSHSTHQDPNGSSCMTFVQGGNANACFRLLRVADHRGFCNGAGLCPLAGMPNQCELINQGVNPPPALM